MGVAAIFFDCSQKGCAFLSCEGGAEPHGYLVCGGQAKGFAFWLVGVGTSPTAIVGVSVGHGYYWGWGQAPHNIECGKACTKFSFIQGKNAFATERT